MKQFFLQSFLIMVVGFANAQDKSADSIIQRDIHYSIEKVMFTSDVNLITKTSAFFILITIDNKITEVEFFALDTIYTPFFKKIKNEILKRKSFYGKQKNKLLVPVFFVSLTNKNEDLFIQKDDFYKLMNSFPNNVTDVRIMKRIILHSERVVR